MHDKTTIAVGIDAGSAQTRCLILAMEDGRLAYLGHGEVESTGWSKSRLVDQKALTACVQSAVRRAEMEARVPVDAMVVGIGGSSIDGHNSRDAADKAGTFGSSSTAWSIRSCDSSRSSSFPAR